MHTYFVSYWAWAQNVRKVSGEAIVPLRKPVGETADLQDIKAHIVRELAETGYEVLHPDVHLVCLQHLHSRPSGVPAP